MTNGRTIIIFGNCQINGIATALKSIFPKDNIVKIASKSLIIDNEKFELFRNCDFFLIADNRDLPDLDEVYKVNKKIKVIRFPALFFSGFHPDMVYIDKLSHTSSISLNYTSAISVWSYINNISIKDAVKLYKYDVFDKLGYLSRYNKSMLFLKKQLELIGFDYKKFISIIKPNEVFMYTINHPNIKMLIQLAKMIAIKMGMKESIYEEQLNIPDDLYTEVWPVYPEIGNSLSVPYYYYTWKTGDTIITGLTDFLTGSYDNYQKSGITSENVRFCSLRDEKFQELALHYVLSEEIKNTR